MFRISTGLGFVLTLAACDAGAPSSKAPPLLAGTSASSDAGDALCTSSPGEGTVCSGGQNAPGLTGISVDNEGLVGNSTNGRGVYGTSLSTQGGYFASTSGDGLLAYSTSGFSGHFTGGLGVMIDPPLSGGGPALTVGGPARFALPAAAPGVVPVCGVLDETSGLFTLAKCDDRLDRLEAEVAALQARLGLTDAGAD